MKCECPVCCSRTRAVGIGTGYFVLILESVTITTEARASGNITQAPELEKRQLWATSGVRNLTHYSRFAKLKVARTYLVNSSIKTWVEEIRSGNLRALSRAITAVENRTRDSHELLKALFAYWSTRWRGNTASGSRAWGSSPSIRPRHSPEGRFWATVSACHRTAATMARSSEAWLRGARWADSPAPRPTLPR